ncbi:MAG: BLUF domain-containing protein [Zoogloeaceae bacterium]|nr:BLUF domain-containing protein [Zoogloeaceae bacterium]
MPRHVRLVYASRANFPQIRNGAGIHPEVARILIQSRRNNARRRVVGGLYFADGCFFQCLEGPAEVVEALYQKLHHDPRHRDLKVLDRREIPAPSFREWNMKHVPDAPEVRELLARHGRTGFEPYSFSPELVESMVALLLGRPDVGDLPALEEAREELGDNRRRDLGRLVAATGLFAGAALIAVMMLQ